MHDTEERAVDSPMLIACSRMYDVTPAVRRHWHALFTCVGKEAGVELALVNHPAPLPLDTLWERRDLGCVFMCGFPYVTSKVRPALLCAPVPSAPRSGGSPVYRSEFVVRYESPFERLDDIHEGTIAWSVTHSYSGYQAPRHFLSRQLRTGNSLFARTFGPLGTPRHTLQAVVDGKADVCAVDSYFFSLLRQYEPVFASNFRVVAHTDSAPIPPLIASRDVPVAVLRALRAALLKAADVVEVRPILEALLLERFASVEPEDYEILLRRSRAADERGYTELR